MALETHVKIVLVAIEQYDRHFVIKFGSELLSDKFSDPAELTQELWNVLATLKWDIWENEGIQPRNSFPDNYSEVFSAIFAVKLEPYDTLESVERTRFHTKEEVEPRDAFAHLDMLIPCKENAFLLRER